MPRLQFKNNAWTTLTQEMSAEATSCKVENAAALPIPGSGQAARVTIDDEIIEYGANDGVDTLSSILRAQEGTSAAVHQAGARVENRVTKGFLEELADESYADTKLALAGGTLSGNVNFADNICQRPEVKDYSETSVAANSSTAYTVDLENGNVFEVTLTGNCTFAFSNPPASGKAGSFTLILKQDGTGGRTVTWPNTVKWAGGTAPTISSDASAVDILVFLTRDAGSTWYGGVFGQAFAAPA